MASDMKVIEDFEAGQTTNTILTPNSNATCTASGDTNDTTQCSFLYNNSIPYWSPSVGSGNRTVELGSDVGNAVVTFKAGLTVSYLPQSGGFYTITVDGQIEDSGSIYNLTGKSLGTFSSKAPPSKE